MTALVIIGAILLIGIAVAVIAWPLVRAQDDASVFELDGDDLEQELTDPLVELEARRDAVYGAIQELRFDHEVGKVSEADFRAFEDQLKGQAVGILQEIDALQAAEADPALDARLEQEILALRNPNGSQPVEGESQVAVQFCSQCGAKAKAGDRFCGRCGVALT